MTRKPSAVKCAARLLVLTLFLLPSFLFGGPEAPDSTTSAKEAPPIEKSGCEAPKPFDVRLSLPMWLAGLSGDAGVAGVVESTELGVGDILRHLTHVPISFGADLRYQRWELFGDGQYSEIGASATLPTLPFTTANIHEKAGFGEVFLGYRLINCTKASLSFFAGARYTYQELLLGLVNNNDPQLPILRELLGLPNRLNLQGSFDWVDPVVGLRGQVKVWKAMSLYAEGDVGGFDANSGSAFELRSEGGNVVRKSVSSSDWSYQVQGGAEIQVTRSIWTKLGWRYLKWDYKSGGFTNDTAFNGLVLETGVNF